MNLSATKGVCVGLLGMAIAVYGASIAGHVFMEYAFARSSLHSQKTAIDLIPGAYLIETDETAYCVDDAVAGRAVGPDRWGETNCDTDPAQRITIFSRYMRKYWVLYLDRENEVVFKRSWVVL